MPRQSVRPPPCPDTCLTWAHHRRVLASNKDLDRVEWNSPKVRRAAVQELGNQVEAAILSGNARAILGINIPPVTAAT